MKNSIYIVLSLMVAIGLMSCSDQQIGVEAGVSIELARHRKQTISDLNYRLYFDIPKERSSAITGQITLSFILSSNREQVLIDFNVDTPQVNKLTVNDKPATFETVSEKIIIPAEFFIAGQNSVFIDFRAGETSLNRNEDYLYTLFVPDRAATAFPCFDQPNLKAGYELSLTIPESWKAIANGASIDEEVTADRKTISFAKTKPLSTYLFAFSAGEFLRVERMVDGRTMTMLHRETDSVKVARNLDEIFRLHGQSIAWLEEYTGIPYPFQKFGFALIPSFQYGGMEHPGAITYKAASLFLDESATQNQLLGRASLIAHETAHMWFGDLVTMDWFSDVWMKEVFANFMAAKIVNPNFPEVNHDLRFLLNHYPSAYAVDRTKGTHPIQQPLENLKNAGTLYGSIIYQKAPIVMRKLERKIGEAAMQNGLRKYLGEYAYNNASWDDLISILDSGSTDNITEWSDQWVKEKGMPVISVWMSTRKDSTVKEMTIFQRDMNNSDVIWPQQLTLKLIAADSSSLLNIDLDERNTEVEAAAGMPEPNFIMTNAGGYGYGFFSLGPQTTQRLLTRMHEFDDPIVRGSAWLDLYEGVLHKRIPPADLFTSLQEQLSREQEQLIVQRMLNYVESLYWKFLIPEARMVAADSVEQLLWEQLGLSEDPRVKSVYFNSFQSLVLSGAGVDKLYKIWSKAQAVPGLSLSETDFTNMAYALALRLPDQADDILAEQINRIGNADRKARMQFIIPALSPDQLVRDEFFESLKSVENRAHESWVQQAIGFLHHPLRAQESLMYISPTLEMLEELQLTGDIFFPKRVLDNTFRGHQSKEAVDAVRQFLYRNNHYPENLKNKILQASDLTFRAAEILDPEQDENRIRL